MNVLTVLGLAVIGYFAFVVLWITRIEDYLQIEEGSGSVEERDDAR